MSYFAILSRKSSHKPGCMRALPASQSCHVRSVEWINSAAADCESSPRAARISSGVGLEEGPFGPLFGWLATALRFFDLFAQAIHHFLEIFKIGKQRLCASNRVFFIADAHVACRQNIVAVGLDCALDGVAVEFDSHFHLQPLSPEARWIRRIHKSYFTRNPCNVKDFFPGVSA